MRQDIIEMSVKQYQKMVKKEPTIEPEDGFIWVLEETDFGEHLSDEKYQEYLQEITRRCMGDAVMFEQLPETVLQRNYGDFGRCEGSWNPMTYDMAERLLKAAQGVGEMLGERTPFKDTREVMEAMNKGRVVHFPLGYMRAKNNLPKCPRCGKAITEETTAISRYDNKTAICSDCGTLEALEDFTGTISD